jgi:hypothetical protein
MARGPVCGLERSLETTPVVEVKNLRSPVESLPDSMKVMLLAL